MLMLSCYGSFLRGGGSKSLSNHLRIHHGHIAETSGDETGRHRALLAYRIDSILYIPAKHWHQTFGTVP
jgi:hypothetical protein